MLDVVALGELLIDFTFSDSNEEGYPVMSAHPGGAPANFLAALAQYGAKTALIGKVGDDAFGRMLRATLEERGVNTAGLVTDPEQFTTLAFVTLDASGDRQFSFARKPGADTQLSYGEVALELIDRAKVLHFGTLSLTDEPARSATYQTVEYAKAQGKRISFDPNLREKLWRDLDEAREQMEWGLRRADIVKISDGEADFLWHCTPEAAAEKLIGEYGVSLALVTLGGDGCLLKTKNAAYRRGALAIKPVDTTGAGDIFGGSANAKLLALGKEPEALTAEDLKTLADFATVAAGLSTLRHGGISSIPSLAEVEKYL